MHAGAARDPRGPAQAARSGRPQGDHHLGQASAPAATKSGHRAPRATSHQTASGAHRTLAAVLAGEASRHLSTLVSEGRRAHQAQERDHSMGGAAGDHQKGLQVPGSHQGQSIRVNTNFDSEIFMIVLMSYVQLIVDINYPTIQLFNCSYFKILKHKFSIQLFNYSIILI